MMNINPAEVRYLIRLATSRTGNAVFDEDLTQEASLRALDAFRRVGHVEHPRAFLMKIVSDTVRDHWRRRRPAEDLDSIDQRFICIQPTLEDDLDRSRRSTLLHHALQSLTGPQRSLLRRFYEEDLSVSEIARLGHTSVSAIKMQLLRTRRQLGLIVRRNAEQKSR